MEAFTRATGNNIRCRERQEVSPPSLPRDFSLSLHVLSQFKCMHVYSRGRERERDNRQQRRESSCVACAKFAIHFCYYSWVTVGCPSWFIFFVFLNVCVLNVFSLASWVNKNGTNSNCSLCWSLLSIYNASHNGTWKRDEMRGRERVREASKRWVKCAYNKFSWKRNFLWVNLIRMRVYKYLLMYMYMWWMLKWSLRSKLIAGEKKNQRQNNWLKRKSKTSTSTVVHFSLLYWCNY